MELGAFAQALLRRWYFVVVALALSAGACVYMISAVGPTYESQASVLLFPPARETSAAEVEPRGNPYLELGGLNQARDILIRALTSQSARDTLAEAHPDADYTLVPDGTSSGPIVVVEVSAPTAGEALAAQVDLLATFPGALADLQEGLGMVRTQFITTRELTVDDRAEAVHKSQIRAAIVVMAALIALSLALIALVDGLLVGRARSRRRPAEGDDPDAKDAPRAENPGPKLPESIDTVWAEELEADQPLAPATAPAPAANNTQKKARKQAKREARGEAVRHARELARLGGRKRSFAHTGRRTEAQTDLPSESAHEEARALDRAER